MGVEVLLDLADLWMGESFDVNGLPSKVSERFASRYSLELGHGISREIMAMAMLAAVGGQAWEQQTGEVPKNMCRKDLLCGAKEYIGLLEAWERGKPVISRSARF